MFDLLIYPPDHLFHHLQLLRIEVRNHSEKRHLVANRRRWAKVKREDDGEGVPAAGYSSCWSSDSLFTCSAPRIWPPQSGEKNPLFPHCCTNYSRILWNGTTFMMCGDGKQTLGTTDWWQRQTYQKHLGNLNVAGMVQTWSLHLAETRSGHLVDSWNTITYFLLSTPLWKHATITIIT